MKRFLAPFVVTSALSLAACSANSPRPNDGDEQRDVASPECATPLSVAEEATLKGFFEASARARFTARHQTEYLAALDALAEDYAARLSPGALLRVSAAIERVRFLELGRALESDPELARAYTDLAEALNDNAKLRELYGRSSVWDIVNGRKQHKLLIGSNHVAKKAYALGERVRASALPPEVAREFLASVSRALLGEAQLDGQAIDVVLRKTETVGATIRVTRDVAIGSALIVGGLVTGGVSTVAGTAVLGATGSSVAAILSAAAVSGAASAGVAGGYSLTKNTVAVVVRSALAEEDFGCRFVRERAEKAPEIYRNSLKIAARAGAIGSTLGAGYAAGGVYYSVVVTADAGLAAFMIGNGVYQGVKEGRGAHALFRAAKAAAEAGNEAEARRLLDLAHAKAVAAGISTLDVAFFTYRGSSTLAKLRANLRNPPAGFLVALAKSETPAP